MIFKLQEGQLVQPLGAPIELFGRNRLPEKPSKTKPAASVRVNKQIDFDRVEHASSVAHCAARQVNSAPGQDCYGAAKYDYRPGAISWLGAQVCVPSWNVSFVPGSREHKVSPVRSARFGSPEPTMLQAAWGRSRRIGSNKTEPPAAHPVLRRLFERKRSRFDGIQLNSVSVLLRARLAHRY